MVHLATIFEMNVESYRRRTAEARRQGPERPATYTTPKVLEAVRTIRTTNALASDNENAHSLSRHEDQLLILIVAHLSP
jgi:hypothetical protein